MGDEDMFLKRIEGTLLDQVVLGCSNSIDTIDSKHFLEVDTVRFEEPFLLLIVLSLLRQDDLLALGDENTTDVGDTTEHTPTTVTRSTRPLVSRPDETPFTRS
jgi:hypothetical protein